MLIVGGAGRVGTILRARLHQHQLTVFDLPDDDATDYRRLVARCAGHDVIVHLAGDFSRESWRDGGVVGRNFELDLNVALATVAAGVPKLVLASSVHADDFLSFAPGHGGELMSADRAHPVPTSPYGAHKLYGEALGRHFSGTHPVEVVAIRLGGLPPDDRPLSFAREPAVFLSRADFGRCVSAVVEAPLVRGRFTVFYAVSDNPGRLHDTRNPFDWHPTPPNALANVDQDRVQDR
jgi:nucleoside-diphosphate-sugar epimerase